MTFTLNRKTVIYGALVVLFAVLAVLAAACGTGKATEPFRDGPVSSQNDAPSVEVLMPDGFSNMAVKCVAPGILGASAYHGDANRAAVALVPDANCK